jgi:hypothetical protein
VRTIFLLGSIIWALTSPLPFLLRAYLRTHLFVTAVLEGLLLFPLTNNFNPNHFYAAVYWPFIAFVSLFQPAVIIWYYGRNMLRCPKLRILLTAWGLMAIYYYGYFRDIHSDRLDNVPYIIYGGAFTLLGLVARASKSQRTPAPA